ncbi:hydroxymethylglutaryl-CoA synthase [Limosilactobacillus caecicola]|uniref:hydroxymethylglutaryl-CoA synthase n=1 Tax=Limosilactobacillus caecicola TaxID=2941332 RepID=UPI00203CBC30|nr:hydroxymethylglutaryl-CoA synthase [Limosilactobacillus caecicola]
MRIGIDEMAFATTPFYFEMDDLAAARGEDPNKYKIGIGQDRQAVVPPTQDIVTLGAQAAVKLSATALKRVSTLIVATESGIDHSKASGIYIKHLLGLNDYIRVVETKEACYSATAALQFARGIVALNPQEVVLIIAADIARYGLNTPGEVTQGAGAVAMLISADPHVLAVEPVSVPYTQDLMDFWRPLYAENAHVDGKYSNQVYVDFFLKTYHRYQQITGRTLADFAALIFHLPYTKMGKKGLEGLLGDDHSNIAQRLRSNLQAEQTLSRQVGNLYTGSLYLGLLSLLQNGDVQPGERIGLFSYGSGAEGEFYSGILQPGYRDRIGEDQLTALTGRQRVSIEEYERLFNGQLGMSAADIEFDVSNDPSPFVLTGQKNFKRLYRIQ